MYGVAALGSTWQQCGGNCGTFTEPTALLLPEILDLVLHHALVSQIHAPSLVAPHHLELHSPEHVTTYYCTLPHLFHRIEPVRRQFYANFIERTSVVLVGISTTVEDNEALCGLAFPRLTALKIKVPSQYGGPLHVPRIQNHRVVVLEVNPHYESCYPESFGVFKKEWEVILEQIPVS
ncbi:hypothetical protein B0H19DRAFT_1077326 [Mycena capillaripes]|nr:hypothetical protein B0H19DRAFT_1077326 [Mycena capillaripes]